MSSRTLLRRAGAAIALTAAAVVLSGVGSASGAVEYDLLRNVNSAKCLDVADGSNSNKAAVLQYTCDASKSHQQWTLEQVGDGSGAVRIKAAHSGKCVDIWDSSQDPTADAIQYTCNATKYNQQFLVEYTASGMKFRARHSGLCLDIEGRDFANKSILHQNTCTAHPAQLFVIG
ncbi:RICIN domain-containing protein [Lentzea sp. NPDC059081]|uniref:RICIN domain-containing protein n=1 Tax=Lentzea sp. NPDC059081 TaxID=3346719 RepID=UPI0036C11FE4